VVRSSDAEWVTVYDVGWEVLKEILRWEGFIEKVGFDPGVKE